MQKRTSKSLSKSSAGGNPTSLLSADEESELDDLVLMEEVKLDLPAKSKKRTSSTLSKTNLAEAEGLQRKGTPEFNIPEAPANARRKITFAELEKLPKSTINSKSGTWSAGPNTSKKSITSSSSSLGRHDSKIITSQEGLGLAWYKVVSLHPEKIYIELFDGDRTEKVLLPQKSAPTSGFSVGEIVQAKIAIHYAQSVCYFAKSIQKVEASKQASLIDLIGYSVQVVTPPSSSIKRTESKTFDEREVIDQDEIQKQLDLEELEQSINIAGVSQPNRSGQNEQSNSKMGQSRLSNEDFSVRPEVDENTRLISELEEFEQQKQEDAKIEAEIYTQRNSMRLVELPETRPNPESHHSETSFSTGPVFPELSNTLTMGASSRPAPDIPKPLPPTIEEERSRPADTIVPERQQRHDVREGQQQPQQRCPSRMQPVGLSSLSPVRVSTLTGGKCDGPVVCRVVTKYPLKNIKAKHGLTEYFAVVVRDNWGECTAFLYDELAALFVDLEVGSVLILREFDVRRGAKTKGKGAVPFELVAKKEGQATILEDEWDADVEQWLGPEVPIELKLVYLESLTNKYEKEAGEFDVLAIIADISNEVQVPTKVGTFLPRRVLKIIDDSRYESELTIWGILKGLDTLSVGDIVIFRSVRLSIFRGRNLSSGNHTKLLKVVPMSCPRLPEIRNLRDAYLKSLELGETVLDIKSLKDSMFVDSEIRSLKDILRASAGLMALPDDATKVFCCVAYIKMFRGKCTYDKCPTKGCMKKVVPDSLIKDLLLCATCGPITGKKPEAKYIGEVELIDASHSIRATFASEEVGRNIFGGLSAEAMKMARELQFSVFKRFQDACRFKSYKFFVQAKPGNERVVAKPDADPAQSDQPKRVLKFEIRWAQPLTRVFPEPSVRETPTLVEVNKQLFTTIENECNNKVQRLMKKVQDLKKQAVAMDELEDLFGSPTKRTGEGPGPQDSPVLEFGQFDDEHIDFD